MRREERRERGETGCKLTAGLGTKTKKNFMRETSEPCINSEVYEWAKRRL